MGFTERQAGFLVTVMLYAGVCLRRHYCAFARIAYGRTMHEFFGVAAGTWLCDRAALWSQPRCTTFNYKPLYRAIGEPNNRHRRPVTLARAVERLMVLDAVLGDGGRTWLATNKTSSRISPSRIGSLAGISLR
jgi:hypothetical protein